MPPRRLWALLLGLFFMAVGMSTNADVLLDLPLQVALVVTLLIAIKFVVLAVTGRVFKLNTAQSLRFAGHIAGFGRFGQILGRVLNARGIRYTAIDRNSEQVQLVRRFGNQVYFGDVTRHQLLENAHAGSARGLALCIDDVEASLAVVRVVCWAVLGWTRPRSNARSAPFSNTTSCW